MATLLMDQGGADPNQACTANGGTALMEAAEQGRLVVARLLLDRSADPNQATTDNGDTAMMYAAHGGHLEIIGCCLTARPTRTRQEPTMETLR